MTEQTSLEEALGGEPEPRESAEQETTEQPQEVSPEPAGEPRAEQPRGPDGKFAAKAADVKPEQEDPAEPGPSPDVAEEQGQLAALKAERQKRQDYEDRLRQAEARAEAIERYYAQQFQQRQAASQQTPPQPQQIPDRWDDPEGHDAYLIQQAEQRAIQRMQAERFDTAERRILSEHQEDGQDAIQAFMHAARTDPSLVEKAQLANDPAEFVYSHGKQMLELRGVMQQHGSLDAYAQSLKAQWEAEARAAITQPTPNLPKSTASDKSVGARSGPAWGGPTPLSAALGQ